MVYYVYDKDNSMRVKIYAFIIISAVLFSACNPDFLDEALTVYEDDSEDLVLTWNANKTLLTATDPETGDVVWYETWEYETDSSSNPILVRRYSPEDRLKWSKIYSWSNGLKIQEVCYDASDQLLWYSVFSYDSNGDILTECNYDESSILQWFSVWGYSGDLKIYNARYNSASVMTNAYTWEYDGSNRLVKEMRYTGSASRNSAGLTFPDPAEPPVIPAFSLSGMSIVDWTLFTYDSYGFFSIKFDSSNYPLELYREDSRMSRAVTAEIEYYSGHVPKSKVIKLGNETALSIDLAYNSGGYLSRIDTEGSALLLPLSYAIDYKSDNSPEVVSVYQSDVKLMYFVYDSEPSGSLAAHPLDPVDFTGSIHSITQYDGDDVKLGSYEFTTEVAENRIKIQALLPDNTPNGHFYANLNGNDEIASFESWSAGGVLQWHYEYDYTEISGKIMRIAEERFDDINSTVNDYNRRGYHYIIAGSAF